MRALLLLLLVVCPATAGPTGEVRFGGLPLPGATVTATRPGAAAAETVTGPDGRYTLPDLAAGPWTLRVSMQGFTPLERPAAAAPEVWELEMLPPAALAQLATPAAAAPKPLPSPAAQAPRKPDPDPAAMSELERRAQDGLLINGTAANAAASRFSLPPAFGNNRRGAPPLYTGNLGLILDHSALDARPYSLTGQLAPRPDYQRLRGVAALGGPLRIPGLVRNAFQFTINYEWRRERTLTTQPARVPTAAERAGELSGPAALDPSTGLPFPGSRIPLSRISPAASALLAYYPLPNSAGDRYNFQTPLAGALHQDSLQLRAQRGINRRNSLSGLFALDRVRTDLPSLFGFTDRATSTGRNSNVRWLHHFQPRLYLVTGLEFSRLRTESLPYFSGRTDVAAAAGITGTDRDPLNWGPPTLQFSSGIASLTGAIYNRRVNQTAGATAELGWSRGRHMLAFGAEYRRPQFRILGQENPRGSFAFTGAAAGSDFAGFLLGLPDTSAIAFGNADKALAGHLLNGYVADDWRVRPNLTLSLGLRWEYQSPLAESRGRLANLAPASGFTAVSLVTGAAAALRPDRNNLAPRVGFAWRPLAGSSMVLRGGYGVYYDTSVYLPLLTPLLQQPPFSRSLRVASTAASPLTLADGFRAPAGETLNTAAIDPGLRIGYAQNWNLSVQRDLPYSLAIIATYAGIKGTRGQQQVLPNTVPPGADACAACPSGFTWLTSNGNSTRHAGTVEVRRRLRAGFTASAGYTWAKAIDNAALGGRNQAGTLLAQNWLDLGAERGRSNFDQRHLLTASAEYTTHVARRGLLAGGWRGRLFDEWTAATQITAGSGLPLTPVYFAAVPGSGVTGTLRPDYTGQPLYSTQPAGLALNPAALAAPAPGRWGNAGRNTIAGPGQFTLNLSAARTFRVGDRLSLDARIDASNALNHPVFPSWNTVLGSAQFGLANPANPMRTVETTLRLRF